MPIYKYICDNCGFDQEQFLNADKEQITTECKRCHHTTIMTQQRDNAAEVLQNGYVQGVVRHDEDPAA
jgi:putative FmdB family regulatory protein